VPPTFDVIIVGLGAMGSATAFHLARRGCKVVGLDRFTPPHTFGSSHGETRIIREAYFEHPVYVPMVQRAYTLWNELERESGRHLFQQTGGLMIGEPDSVVVRGAKLSAEMHQLPHQVLSAKEIRERFPALRPNPEMIGVLEPRAGILFPERCVSAHLEFARRRGASLRFDETVLNWNATSQGVSVRTPAGEIHAAKLVLCAGSWIQTLLPDLNLPFKVERQVLYWFEPQQSPALFQPQRCPIHLWQYDGRRFFYGFPDLGDGVKVARHHEGNHYAGRCRRSLDGETEAMRAVVQRFLPGRRRPLRSATVCLYTDTPDEHFWIDWHLNTGRFSSPAPARDTASSFPAPSGRFLLICWGKEKRALTSVCFAIGRMPAEKLRARRTAPVLGRRKLRRFQNFPFPSRSMSLRAAAEDGRSGGTYARAIHPPPSTRSSW
jgi:sarcosine oxidase